MFSFPKILTFTDRIVLRQNPVQWPINLPPLITIFWGRNSAGKNIIDIIIIPEKKITENTKFLNIILMLY